MPSGGARARSGPAPDPNALRRDRDAGEWITLPADGRPGESPAWPLPLETVREDELWDELWSMPQAVEWERQRQHLEVALYVRRFVEAEKADAPTALGTLVRQMADSLGLTTPGLRSHRWKIGNAPAASNATTAATTGTRPSARDRFSVVPGGA